ncbi:hypothetical protein Ssi03_25760 [Sphaerisporangium siamense]|uniref:Phage portal protein n=1 Tax=Sphaerisporangium siamense TaxID=795645 RepID=A0A7W7D4D7_9ACTN|nr:phage capsid protein [Sphaerisporangium siamense]MBB4700097.1 hypothetical protein [Sphaerisporangium siamense]GII84586.1 hypothetical protein Ssi03_25760 [Sphaerisporangium siamense]
MPLPAPNTAWPPPALADIYRDYDEADAWYSGDKTRLATHYTRAAQPGRDREHWHQYVHRMWAQSHDLTRPDSRLHVPLAGDIAATSADLLFSEPPTFTVEDATTQERLEEILEEGGVHMRLLEAAEVDSGLGDVYIKLCWDADVAQRPIWAIEHGDAAIPTFRWGRLVEVTFWRELERSGDQVVRFLEHHEPGLLTYAAFQGTSQNLGQTIPLDSREDTKELAAGADADGRRATGIGPLLTATHIPNMRPNRRHRGLPFGRSDYAAPCYDLFDALDQVWTSLMRDIRLARARLIVPQGYLTNLGAGQGAAFDAEREVFQELTMDPSQSGGITLTQFELRVADHMQSAESIIGQAVRSAGYSAQSFGLAGDVAVTATEVAARERRSMVTRDRKIQYWVPALRRIVEATLALDRALGWSTVEPVMPTVEFGSAVSQDAESVARTLQMLEAARAVSSDTKVRMLHPDWDDEQVRDEVQRIKDDEGTPVADPLALRPGDQQPAEGEEPPPGEAPADDET